MEIKSEISNLATNFLRKNFSVEAKNIEIQTTRKDFEGDITIVLFPFLKDINEDNHQFGEQFGEYIGKNSERISDFNVEGGFLNLTISDNYLSLIHI